MNDGELVYETPACDTEQEPFAVTQSLFDTVIGQRDALSHDLEKVQCDLLAAAHDLEVSVAQHTALLSDHSKLEENNKKLVAIMQKLNAQNQALRAALRELA